jgi:hypothetical protein
MQVGIGMGPGFGAPGTARKSYARVVFVGASIVEQPFGRNLTVPNATRTAAFRAAGLAVDVIGFGWGGYTIAPLIPKVQEALAAYPADTLFVIEIGGNNISATRPWANASTATRNQIAADWANLLAACTPRKADIVICSETFRTYQGAADIAALPNPRDAVFADEALGSRPYNDSIFIPGIAAWRPETMNSDGNPVVDLYNATRNIYETYVSGDGVHPSDPVGRDQLVQIYIDRLAHFINATPKPAPIAPRGVVQVAPVNTGTPVISGAAQEGQVLSASLGTWTGTAPITHALQWRRGGAAISGATGATYALAAADVGAAISVTVTATNAAGSASATSVATGPVTAASAQRLIVNFGNVAPGFLGTNYQAANVKTPGNSLTPVLLKYDDGTNSAVSLLVSHPSTTIGNNTYNNNVGGGRVTGVAAYDGTLFNDAIYGSSIFADMNAGPFTLALSGLTPGAAYSLSFAASRNAAGPRVTQITDGVVTLSYDATLTPPPAPVTGVFAANAAGVITLTVSNPAGTALNTWAYLGGMRVAAT